MLLLRFQSLAIPLIVASCLAVPGAVAAQARTDHLILSGSVDRPGFIAASQLQGLPAVTRGRATPAARRYVGASLWSVLDNAGIQIDASRRNDLLNRYAVVTGADGRKVVFSLGELSPAFGNRPGVVAYGESRDGAVTSLRDGGRLQVTMPSDLQDGRHVDWPVRVDVRSSASTMPENGDVVSTALRVGGAVRRPGTFDLAALKALPAVTRTVGGDVYVGVSLWHLLGTTLGLAIDPAVRHQAMSMYVVATGSDGTRAVVSIGEIDPAAGNQPDLVAYQINGVPLDVDGFARLVLPNDARQSRFITNLVALEVFVARP